MFYAQIADDAKKQKCLFHDKIYVIKFLLFSVF